MRISDWSSDVFSSDLFVSDVTKEDAVNNSIPAASSTNGSIDPNLVDGMQSLRTGLGLLRASQFIMVRFQLALYKTNRRTAMQALDNLLDIDAELEGLAATLTGIPAHLADEAALPDFIGLQRTAIAAEKHALTGGDWRGDTKAIAIAAAGMGRMPLIFPRNRCLRMMTWKATIRLGAGVGHMFSSLRSSSPSSGLD